MCMYCGFTKCPSGCPNSEPVTVGKCHWCLDDITAGETVYKIDGDMYHECCVRDNAYDILTEVLNDRINLRYGYADEYSGFLEA